MADEHDPTPAVWTEQDLALLRDAASTTRLVRLHVGERSVSLGWFEIEPGETFPGALAQFLHRVATFLEERDAQY